jgi:RHS repeat-associated protein
VPFGDGLNCSGNTDPGGLHFTGKKHDVESGLDYFGARYYDENVGRFTIPDPGWMQAASPSNPQSWNQYAYAGNNPVTNIDPTGTDCVYFNAAGNGIESTDSQDSAQNAGTSLDQQSSDCGANGGDWVNGTTSTALGSYNSKTDTWNIGSYDSENGIPTVYWTQASAPGSQMNGSGCSGNCDTANGYSSTGFAFFSNQMVSGNWYDALHWAVGQTSPVPAVQRSAISDPEGQHWCGKGGAGVPSGQDDWSCMAHDYNYMMTGNSYPGDNLKPFSGNKQLQKINQTLCDNVTSSNIKAFFTYTSFAGCH